MRVAHAWPLSRGGETVYWNLVTLCIKCWRAKGKKTPPEFLESYYYQFTVLKRHVVEEEIKKVRVVFKNGHTVEGEMKVDPGILADFSIKVKSKGIIRLLPKKKIDQIDLLEDLTDNEAQVT